MENPSPNWSFPSFPFPVKSEQPEFESQRRLICDGCGGVDFDGGDDGFFYCRVCGSQSQDVMETACAQEDILGQNSEGALYNRRHHRAQTHSQSQSNARLPTKEELLKSLNQNLGGVKKEEEEGEEEERPYTFKDESSEPLDFGGGSYPDADALSNGIRMRFIEGLQVMIQMQCEALVKDFSVSPLICGIVGSIWLRYVSMSRVFADDWADNAKLESEEVFLKQMGEQGEQNRCRVVKPKYRSEPLNKYGQRAIFIWSDSLRKMIPVYSSLAICFLSCHIARESILPTDISNWALEGKLPYLSAFVEIEKVLGTASSSCPLSLRLLLRPVRSVGAWQLEATAGSIARCIGLHLPPVNFYAIAQRFLNQLSLPLEEILPHACRLYQWSMPAELWLSANTFRLPTRVCVMSILIVAVRILYNIHGHGSWEKSLSSNNGFGNGTGGVEEDYRATTSHKLETDSASVKNLSDIQNSEFNTAKILHNLEAAYDKINETHEYSKDLASYLKYCKDVIFAGLTTSFEEDMLIEKLWNVYESRKDDNLCEERKTGFNDVKKNVSKDEQNISSWLDVQESTNALKPGDMALRRMKLNMEENGFNYLPPRIRKRTTDYVHYKRKRAGATLHYVAHADYYILLRACAKLAQVDVRIMHLGVLKLERKLGWIEKQISSSLPSLCENFDELNGKLKKEVVGS